MDRSDSTRCDSHTRAGLAAPTWRSVWLHRARRPAQMVLWCVLALHLAACSRTVEWQEEVPLNTGETIWVKRKVVYSLQGASGNPLDIGYRPNKTETLSFRWEGKDYFYKGDAALMLLAISPARQPTLVAPASDRSWDWRHDYYCASPHYVQFSPDVGGHKWTWPPQIEPWLYGMRHNLMRKRRPHGEMLVRYSASQREEEDRTLSIQAPSRVVIDPALSESDCKKRN
jgi:hypothetical protein